MEHGRLNGELLARLEAEGAGFGVHPNERRYLHEDLDLDYVQQVASDVADALTRGAAIEVNFQPGDATRYPLVFVPLHRIDRARPRVKDGQAWSSVAVEGMPTEEPVERDRGMEGLNERVHRRHTALVAHVEGSAYSVDLHPGRGYFGVHYVAEHWTRDNVVGGATLALLFGEVSARLDA